MLDLLRRKPLTMPMLAPENDDLGGDPGAQDTETKVTISDKELKGRIHRAQEVGAKKAQEELLKSFGFEKADDLKVLLDTVRAQQEAEKTDLQKAQEEANRLKSEKESALAEANRIKLEAKFERLAAQKGIKPERLERVMKMVDMTDETVMTESLEDLIKDMPELISKPGPERFGSDFSSGNQGQVLDINKLSEKELMDPKIWDQLMKQNKK